MRFFFPFYLLLLFAPLTPENQELAPSAYLSSEEGQRRLLDSPYKHHYWQLALYYETQQLPTFCGVATSVMVLNAMQIPRPIWQSDSVFTLFMQEYFFSPEVLKIVSREKAENKGITLMELTHILRTFGVAAEPTLGEEIDVDCFREVVKKTLENPDSYLIINYNRIIVGQLGKGHFAPLASYDEKTDSVLIMDVARFKYPPAWLPLSSLVKSMQNPDDEGASRGFIVVKRA